MSEKRALTTIPDSALNARVFDFVIAEREDVTGAEWLARTIRFFY